MRKRFFFPLFVLFVFFPLIIFLLSFTRFFNDGARDLLTSLVDDGTNAQLHLGEIHGSVFGSFTIDGAALLLRGEPVALVDTVRITHLPLSLITKTVQATKVELVNPRFHLVRYKDGTYNVDHIGRPSGRKGGPFDWTILAKMLRIRDGYFSLYDSTVDRTAHNARAKTTANGKRIFDATDFSVGHLYLDASADLSGDNLSVNVHHISMNIDPPGMKVDSLKLVFFTSPGGTEVSGLRLRSGSTVIHLDVTLTGQDLLDSLNENTIRNKYFTAAVQARDFRVGQISGFVKLPINSASRFDLSMFASGTLDTFSVKQFLLNSDSSAVPVSASFRHVLDSTFAMNVSTNGASIEMQEISAILRNIGFPDASRLRRVRLDASVVGRPRDLKLSASLANDTTAISATSRISGGTYDGSLTFRGLDVGEIINSRDIRMRLNGKGTYSLATRKGSIPDGTAWLQIDSSTYDRTAVPSASVRFTSADDSLATDFNFITSKGNVDGRASLNAATDNYSGDFTFSELDFARFVHVPTLEGSITGRLLFDGRGFNIDSLRTRLSLITERSNLGDLRLGNSAFTLALNTERPERELQVHSPYVDASVNGSFVPHELPGQLARLFAAIADTFGAKLSGRIDTTGAAFAGAPKLNADVDIDVKDARLFGQLLGNTEMSGRASTHIRLNTGKDSVSISGYASADSLSYARDSLALKGSGIYVGFNYLSDSRLSVWDSGSWSADADVRSLSIGSTSLSARSLHVGYTHGDSSTLPILSLGVEGEVDTVAKFDLNATAEMSGDVFSFVTDTLRGNVLGISLRSQAPVQIRYSPEKFVVSPATFHASLKSANGLVDPSVMLRGSYSLRTGADLHFVFSDFTLKSVQDIARLDTATLRLNGLVSGSADLVNTGDSTLLSVAFTGKDVGYNGSIARLLKGRLELSGPLMTLDAELSKQDNPNSFSLRLNGTIPLSEKAHRRLHLDVAADSQDVSFLTPFMSGIEDFGGTLSGNMTVSGSYSSPEMRGKLTLDDGRIRLAANDVNYLFSANVQGEGNKLLFSPVVVRNVPGQTGGTILANGSITIGQNTIQKFDLVFDGQLLVLNSTARRTLKGIYGTAIVGAGRQGLRLGGSLDRPMLSGTLSIQSADLTLLPLQKQENLAAQEIIYHFPPVNVRKEASVGVETAEVVPPPKSSGSLLDSLRYDVEVETKDNVNLRMIFDPTTNEELSAVLGGRLHLSNLSGDMELTGDVSVLTNSYYNFYGRHFAATGKLSFTGNPLNPTMDIAAQYQGEHISSTDTTNQKSENVVVQLGITGSFDRPNAPDISLTVDGVPYQGDAQTNAISFILTNEFADELTNPQRRVYADNAWSTGILSAGTSILSGALTNLFSREFSFIRSAELRYSSISDITNPDVAITTQFGRATIRVGGQVFSDIGNTDVSVDYPLTDLLGNMLYLQLSRRVALNNRTYLQRETVNALRLFYQLSF